MAQSIENTVFNPTLPCNPIPVITRLRELIGEHPSNDPQVLMEDDRISQCLWLLNAIMLGTTIGEVDMFKWHQQLVQRRDQS